MDEINAVHDSDRAITTSATTGKHTSWNGQLFKSNFDIAVRSGAVSQIKLRCKKKYVVFQYEPRAFAPPARAAHGSPASMLQQVIAVATAFVQAALVRGMAFAFAHFISVGRAVGSDRRVEDRIAVRSSVRAALLECSTTVVISRCGDVLALLGGVTSTSVHSKDGQTQDSGYAYDSLHDLTRLPMATGKMKGHKQSPYPSPLAVRRLRAHAAPGAV